MSPLMWMCTLLMAAVLATMVTLGARNRASLSAQLQASEAWRRTGRAQPGWSGQFAWAHDRCSDEGWADGDDAADERPVTVTAEVIQPEPARWWHQDTVRPQSTPVTTSGPVTGTTPMPTGEAVRAAVAAPAAGQGIPPKGARATVDGVPGQVTGFERQPGATRVIIRRSDGVVGHVDIPDVDHVVPVPPAPRSEPSARPRTGHEFVAQVAERETTRREAAPRHASQPPAPFTSVASAVTLGGFTVPVGGAAPGTRTPARHQSDAEKRTNQLRDGGYTGPIDPDGYPAGWATPAARPRAGTGGSAPSRPAASVTLGGFTIAGSPQ